MKSAFDDPGLLDTVPIVYRICKTAGILAADKAFDAKTQLVLSVDLYFIDIGSEAGIVQLLLQRAGRLGILQ